MDVEVGVGVGWVVLSKSKQRIVVGYTNTDKFSVYRINSRELYRYVQSINCGFSISGISISDDDINGENGPLSTILVTGSNNIIVYKYNK